MKRFNLILVTLLTVSAFVARSQALSDPSALQQAGKAKYDNKEYIVSAQLFAHAFALIEDRSAGSQRYSAAYNSACSWALAGKSDSAFRVLETAAAENNFGTYYNQLLEDADFLALHQDKRWILVCNQVKVSGDAIEKRKKQILSDLTDTTRRINHSLLTENLYWKKQMAMLSYKALRNKIRGFKAFAKAPATSWWTLYYLMANDTLRVPFLVHIPATYSPFQKTPLFVFLHGGVGRNRFSDPVDEVAMETPVLKRAEELGAIIIFPFADQKFNWLHHQLAFETLLKEIAQVKSNYNIDDNKVYIGGHSDGARGAFWYALNMRTPFAAYFGISYFPTSLTGNTLLGNLRNESPFYGISAIQDKGFNIKTVREMANYAQSMGANWKSFAVNGAHTLPYDQPDSVSFIYDTIIKRSRNPVPQTIQWETDDVRNGRCHWISIARLDTLAKAAGWQKVYNPTITSIRTGKAEVRNFNKNKSGMVIASISGNELFIKTSRVKELVIHVPDRWTDKYRFLKIHLNGRPVVKMNIGPDKEILLMNS